ncbi:DUF4864 domain-containing protein [Roseivivax sp. CAU 1761]
MLRNLVLTLALAVLASAAPAQTDADRAGIEAVISGQMDAFRADDMGRAFDYAAPFIQQRFGTAEAFGLMVERGYPMVHRPADIRFGALRAEGAALWQRVFVRDAAGALHVLEYQMLDLGGGWRIGGVRLLPQTGAAA